MNNQFLILYESLEEVAKGQLLNDIAIHGYITQIVLKPSTFYVQKTDKIQEGEYSVYIADLCGNNLLDVSGTFTISEQTNGNYFELFVGKDFERQAVCLKITNLINLQVYYSNPFYVTESFKSTEFDYKNVGDNFMQSIGLNCYFTRAVQESEERAYIQESGVKVSGKSVITEYQKFVFEKLDNFTYRKLNYLLATTQKYINGIRLTDKPLAKDGDFEGTTNVFKSEFIGAINYNETFTRTPQLFLFDVSETYPIAGLIYKVSTINDEIFIKFNRSDVVNDFTKLAKLYKNGVFVQNLVDDTEKFKTTFNFTEIGSYSVEIEAGKFKNQFFGLPFFSFNFEIEPQYLSTIDSVVKQIGDNVCIYYTLDDSDSGATIKVKTSTDNGITWQTSDAILPPALSPYCALNMNTTTWIYLTKGAGSQITEIFIFTP